MKLITIENPRQCRYRLCLAREVYKCTHPALKSSEPLSLLCFGDDFDEACPLPNCRMKNMKLPQLQPVARHEFIEGVKKTLCPICKDKDCENCKHMQLAEKFPIEVKRDKRK